MTILGEYDYWHEFYNPDDYYSAIGEFNTDFPRPILAKISLNVVAHTSNLGFAAGKFINYTRQRPDGVNELISFSTNDNVNVIYDRKIVNIKYKVEVYKGKGTALLVFEYWE